MKRVLLAAWMWCALVTAAYAQTTPNPWPSVCIQNIAMGQTINGTLTTDDCAFYFASAPSDLYYVDIYAFNGVAGEQVAISMNSTDVDSWLDLYNVNDLNASPLISDDDGGGGNNARIPPTDGYYTLPATGTYYIYANTYGAGETGNYTLSISNANGTIVATEFYHPTFDHYFITAYPEEAASLAAGNLPPWVPTGNTFLVWSGPGNNISNVWRFFSASFAPKSGHFYTNNADEAAGLQAGNVWTLEASDAFYMMASPTGACPSGTSPLFRLYNNGMGGAPNHRYTTDQNIRASMISAGWIPEGNGDAGVFACIPTNP